MRIVERPFSVGGNRNGSLKRKIFCLHGPQLLQNDGRRVESSFVGFRLQGVTQAGIDRTCIGANVKVRNDRAFVTVKRQRQGFLRLLIGTRIHNFNRTGATGVEFRSVQRNLSGQFSAHRILRVREVLQVGNLHLP